MKTITALWLALAVATTAHSSTTYPGAVAMASTAYRVPETRIRTAVEAMRRDLRVSDADMPQALGILAHCGKSGMVEYGDLVDGVTLAAPAWSAAMHHEGIERAFDIGRDGLLDVYRLCRTLEVARRGHGSSPDTIAAVVATLKGRDQASTVARTMIGGIEPVGIDGVGELRADYRERLRHGV